MTGALALLLALQAEVLSLNQAEHRAEVGHPALTAGQADSAAAAAVAMEARAALMPQISLAAGYRYATANRTVRIGTSPAFVPAVLASRPMSTNLYDYLTTGITLSQLIYDFGQSTGAARTAALQAEAAAFTAESVRLDVLLGVRLAFFAARARKELLDVAREGFATQQQHLAQVGGYVEVKMRPPIDLVQARADVGTMELRMITAENDYAMAKVDLERAMGGVSGDDFEVGSDALPAIEDEGQSASVLFAGAAGRPDLVGADRQVKANEQALSAARGGYFPQVHLVLAAIDAGPMFHPGPFASDNLRWNYSAGLTLAWPLLEGGRTVGRNRQAGATLDASRARRALLETDVRVQIERARRGIITATATVRISQATVVNARERLRLATGRYQAGVGTALEARDAQLAYLNAAADGVQAQFDLSVARAQLLRTLGRAY